MLSLHSVRCFSNLALQVLTIGAYTDSTQVAVILSVADACISSSERTPGCLQTESSRCTKMPQTMWQTKLITVTRPTHLENLQLHSMIAMCQLHRRHEFSWWQCKCAWMDMSSSDVSFVHLLSHFLPFGNPACNLSEMRTAFSRSPCKACLCSYPFFELSGATGT